MSLTHHTGWVIYARTTRNPRWRMRGYCSSRILARVNALAMRQDGWRTKIVRATLITERP